MYHIYIYIYIFIHSLYVYFGSTVHLKFYKYTDIIQINIEKKLIKYWNIHRTMPELW